MKKTVTISSVVAVVLLMIGMFVWLQSWARSYAEGTDLGLISERAREFVYTHPDLDWVDMAALNGESRTPLQEVTPMTSCFRINAPIDVRSSRVEEDRGACAFSATLGFPRASLTVLSRPLSSSIRTLEEVPDVNFRSQYPEVYKSTQLAFSNIGAYDDYVMYKADQELAFFALQDGKLVVIGLYQLPRVTEDSYELLRTYIEQYQPL